RTVNHRYFNLNARLPSSLAKWEVDIRDRLRSHFPRGHVNLTARWEADEEVGETIAYRLDEAKVATYLRLFRELSERFGVAGAPDLALLARYNDIIVRADEEEAETEVGPEELLALVDRAAAQVVTMREEE